MLIAATQVDIPTIRASLRGSMLSPESHIAALTSRTETTTASSTASMAAIQTCGPSPTWSPLTAWKTLRAIPAVTASWARLKATRTATRPGVNTSTSAAPATHASMTSPGAQNSSPTTSGSSPRASVCELRRKCTWTTEISVAAKASASAHQGICTDGTGTDNPMTCR